MAQTSVRERVCHILDSARADRPLCYAVVQAQIEVLAAAIANVILLIQPNIVVVGGLLSALPPDLFATLEIAIRRHTPALIGNNMLVQQGRLATQSSAAIGANHHFLQQYLAEVGEMPGAPG
jgi:predicted NBD/HSP70 family sugar kinase